MQREDGAGEGAESRDPEELERTTLAKVSLRLIPFMFALYVVNILDRVNVGVAALTMNKDLGFTDGQYGFGYGIFFIGYFLLQVPSNVLLERFSPRIWIAGITIAWGIIASCLMFVNTPSSFYVMRFLLGVAEAGFFPGMMLYSTYWFPEVIRGRAAARFILANVFANIIGGPLGAQLMELNGLSGLRGWQWLFLLEGLPAILLGFAVLFYMTDRPPQALWLKPEERQWLIDRLDSERAHRQKHHPISVLQAFAYPRVLHLSLLFVLNATAGAGLASFANLILKQRSGWSDHQVLWISALPSILGAAALMLSASISDRRRERRLHVVTGLLVAACGVMIVATTTSPLLMVVGLCTVNAGTSIANAPFWALTTGFLSGTAAAGGIAFINSIGNTGSFWGPSLIGYLKTALGGHGPGLLILAGLFVAAATAAYLLPPDPAQSGPRD